jgi:hypothetical protein
MSMAKSAARLPQLPKRSSAAAKPAVAKSSLSAVPSQRAASVREIPLDAIDWSWAVRSLDRDHINRLAGAARLPAIKVWEFRPREYRGIDGYHRWRIAADRGEQTVVSLIYQFPRTQEGEKAFEAECIRSNIHHGLPFTKAQRDVAIVRFWRRWGRTDARPAGETLDSVARLFGLTKQRVHQILSSTVEPGSGERGFSSFGRFTAATRRMSTLLADARLFDELMHEREVEVIGILQDLHSTIARVLTPRSTDSTAARMQ